MTGSKSGSVGPANAVTQEHDDVEHQEFDDHVRALAASGSRRGAIGALAGLLGVSLLGAEEAAGRNPQKRRRRRQRRRKKQNRRDRRGGPVKFRGIKMWVENLVSHGEPITVEFGFESTHGCCQGQAAYTIGTTETKHYETEDRRGYVWINSKYFITFFNPFVTGPEASASINGATTQFSPGCCKPRGTELYYAIRMGVDELLVFDFAGQHISILRYEDEDNYKVFALAVH